MEYISLFFSALIAATLLPMGSEILLVTLLNQGHNALLLWGVATLGNTLGSVINYALGYWANTYVTQKYADDRHWQKAQNFYNRYGIWSLLFAWLPIIGDPITLIAGLARTHFTSFLLLVFIGKSARYALLIVITLGLI